MRFRRSRFLMLWVVLLLALASGCGEKKENATPLPESPLVGPEIAAESPLVVQEPQTTQTVAPGAYAALTPVPFTPAPGKGVVTGVITRDVRGAPLQPIANLRLYLAKMVTGEGDPLALASLDENKAPASLTNADGQFVFVGVEPGEYALIVKTPIQTILAHDVVKDLDIVTVVTGDQATELGDIHIDLPY